MTNEYITKTEALQMLQIASPTFDLWKRNGKIISVGDRKIPGRRGPAELLYRRSDIQALARPNDLIRETQ